MLAELALRLGDLRAAESHGLAVLADLEQGAFNHATGREILGETARRSGGGERARERFEDSLRSFAALQDAGGTAHCLDGLARLVSEAGDLERAGRLSGAAQRMRETWGRIPIRPELPLPDVPEAERPRGGAMTFDEAVEYALSVDRPP